MACHTLHSLTDKPGPLATTVTLDIRIRSLGGQPGIADEAMQQLYQTGRPSSRNPPLRPEGQSVTSTTAQVVPRITISSPSFLLSAHAHRHGIDSSSVAVLLRPSLVQSPAVLRSPGPGVSERAEMPWAGILSHRSTKTSGRDPDTSGSPCWTMP